MTTMTNRNICMGVVWLAITIALLAGVAVTDALATEPASTTPDSLASDTPEVEIGHGSKGWYIRTKDGRYAINIDLRLQFRYAYPWDTSPVTFKDFEGPKTHTFKVNRSRLKIGGNAMQPWLEYYMEYELGGSILLDYRGMLTRWSALQLKVGQWKVQYSRERIISSGKQQLADRSIVNRVFTVDRQQGVSLYGRLEGGGAADLSYWLSVFTGTGRGGKTNDDSNPMWMARAQWNPFGRVDGFSGSDYKRHEQAAVSIALAAVTNRSPYTRFSSAGGGQLPGFDDGEPGQYRINQALLETAFKYRGWAWQQELHWKEIDDRVNADITVLRGNVAQIGYTFRRISRRVPAPFELAFRHAIYDSDKDKPDNNEQEFTLAANCFLNGHRNKLTAELSHFDYHESATEEREATRIRLQWEVSF